MLPEFPPATRLVVVDPGVGTDRAALAIEAGDHRLVTVGSHGYVEFAVSRGRGDEAFGLGVSDAVELRTGSA